MRRYRTNSVYKPAVDEVAREEPLEIQARYWMKDTERTEAVAIAMRTPGNDAELAAGYLYCEGILDGADDIQAIHAAGREITVEFRRAADIPDLLLRRRATMNSACGICGKTDLASLPQIGKRADAAKKAAGPVLRRRVLYGLPALLRSHQDNFQRTGGLHAAALVDEEGHLLRLFEDIGQRRVLQ